MIIGLSKTIEKYEELTAETKADITNVIKKDAVKNKEVIKEKLSNEKIDSIKKNVDDKMKNFIIPVPEETRKVVLQEIEKEAKDTIKSFKGNDFSNFTINGDTRLEEFSAYVKKSPDSKIDVALDSLGYDKTFTNRFLFTKAKSLYSITKNEESKDQFLNQVLSYGSFALFILLPVFTLFLRFFYIRRKFTYVDHLIFVFHIQTVFFMLFSIFSILEIIKLKPELWIFVCLFLLYLIIAMKKFYQQGYIKTFFKFLLLNLSYTIVASIGIMFVFLISFVMF